MGDLELNLFLDLGSHLELRRRKQSSRFSLRASSTIRAIKLFGAPTDDLSKIRQIVEIHVELVVVGQALRLPMKTRSPSSPRRVFDRTGTMRLSYNFSCRS